MNPNEPDALSISKPNSLQHQARNYFQSAIPSRRLAAFMILIPLICMMMGSNPDEPASLGNPQERSAKGSNETNIQRGDLGGSCRGETAGFCVPIGMCAPEDKIQGTEAQMCDAGLECCGKKLNNNLCRSKGGECVDIGSCGEGIALFREAEDCNRARHGKDCCIWT